MMNALDQLKADPETAIRNNHYYLEPSQISTEIGVDFTIDSTGNIHKLKMHVAPANYSMGYYFPYYQQGTGQIGHVQISTSKLFDGMIVITDGMNGCALEVRYNNDGYHFYHDANSAQGALMNPGTQTCRINSNAYWNQHQINSIMSRYLYPFSMVQFICIYRHGFWHIVCCGFITILGTDGTASKIATTFDPPGGKYRGYFNVGTHLIQ